ncbi:SDR family NAD(P)-dependent oxidoreductase, partial [bacterium]|nr:SDR family NAD(P)-dependent oxidoreductase [bacterium]
MRPVVVFGGYGTFGSLVSRELAAQGVPVIVAGRDGERAQALAEELGAPHQAAKADVTDRHSCRRAVEERSVAVSCAGPFGKLGPALLDA